MNLLQDGKEDSKYAFKIFRPEAPPPPPPPFPEV